MSQQPKNKVTPVKKINRKALLWDTGLTLASMVLFPAIGQSIGLSPVLTKALHVTLSKTIR